MIIVLLRKWGKDGFCDSEWSCLNMIQNKCWKKKIKYDDDDNDNFYDNSSDTYGDDDDDDNVDMSIACTL